MRSTNAQKNRASQPGFTFYQLIKVTVRSKDLHPFGP
ncbi:hypothetical protein SAMN05444394_0677 [Algoriphagus halophilus]|uniref:Uncharacterized protein n=1 Tax=Algoriphagus halophilus TaxID=226505 RepID=A0A1N6DC18_9BACT|nr:hypothetical protein SAMN05444394_0677 [Algoriphagus halophilus]